MGRVLNALDSTPWPWTPAVWSASTAPCHWTLSIANTGGWAAGGTTAPPWLTTTAWDIVLDLDATRNPIATLRANLVIDGHDLYDSFQPEHIRHITISAGWQANQQYPLFYGYLTSVTRRDGYYTITARSVDALWAERPLFTDYQIPAGATSMASLTLPGWLDDMRFANWSPDTPTGSQLAEFRAQKGAEGDSIDDFARTAAACLGVTLRAIHRTLVPHGGPQYHALGPVTSRTRLTLTDIENLEETKDTDTVTVYVLATATWTDAGTSKTETLMVTPDGGVWQDWQTPKPVTLRTRPAPGGLYDSRRVFQQFLRPTGTPRYTFTARALWWLAPDHGLTIPTPTGPANVNIERIQYHVDAGTMTITATT